MQTVVGWEGKEYLFTQSSLLLCMDGLVVGDLLIAPLLDLKEPFDDESCPGNTVIAGKGIPDPQVDGQIPAIIFQNSRGLLLVHSGQLDLAVPEQFYAELADDGV